MWASALYSLLPMAITTVFVSTTMAAAAFVSAVAAFMSTTMSTAIGMATF